MPLRRQSSLTMLLMACFTSVVSILLIQQSHQSVFNRNETDLSFEPPPFPSSEIASSPAIDPLPLVDTTGIDKTIILGNSTSCTDLVYTCDGRLPSNSTTFSTQNRSIVMLPGMPWKNCHNYQDFIRRAFVSSTYQIHILQQMV